MEVDAGRRGHVRTGTMRFQEYCSPLRVSAIAADCLADHAEGSNANQDMAADRTADGAASRARGAALLRAVLLRGCPRQSVAACRRSRTSGACRGAVPAVPAAHRDRQARYGSPARQPGGAAAVLRHPLLPGRAQPSDAALPADAELLAVRGRGDTPARSGPRKLADRTPPTALPARRRRFRPGAIAGLDGGWPCLRTPCRSVGRVLCEPRANHGGCPWQGG